MGRVLTSPRCPSRHRFAGCRRHRRRPRALLSVTSHTYPSAHPQGSHQLWLVHAYDEQSSYSCVQEDDSGSHLSKGTSVQWCQTMDARTKQRASAATYVGAGPRVEQCVGEACNVFDRMPKKRPPMFN